MDESFEAQTCPEAYLQQVLAERDSEIERLQTELANIKQKHTRCLNVVLAHEHRHRITAGRIAAAKRALEDE